MVASFLLVISLGAVVAGITLTRASMKVRGWPVASGRIVEREVGPSTTTGASRPGRYFEPRVKYAYTVEGKSYTGHRIGLVTSAYDEDTAKNKVNDLPETVEVHYNPDNPGDAYLQPAALGLGIFIVIAGALGMLIGAGLLLARFADKG